MVTITPEAIAMIERLIVESELSWFVTIRWRKGAADNHRAADGGVVWDVQPNPGWVAELGGWEPYKVPPGHGEPLCGPVRLIIQNFFAPEPFPGGEIYVAGDELKVRTNAI
jgi:hypothetical protein